MTIRVKPLAWRFWPNGFPPFWEGNAGAVGYYCIEERQPVDEGDDEPADGDERPIFSITDPFHRPIGAKRDLEAAQAVAQAHFDALIRGTLEPAAKADAQTVNINGTEHRWDKPSIAHEDICRLANEPVHASVTWSHGQRGRTRSGMTSPGRVIPVFDGMNIDCVVTGDA